MLLVAISAGLQLRLDYNQQEGRLALPPSGVVN
mgnify:CR=1 FL=1